MDLINEQLGRILLVLAIAWAISAGWLNRPVKTVFPNKIKNKENVQVGLQEDSLKTANPEVFYAAEGLDEAYRGPDRYPFVPPVVVFVFQSVPLKVPTATLMPPPMVLPSPGPMLEGTDGLPRWGDEFPPMVPPADETDDPRR